MLRKRVNESVELTKVEGWEAHVLASVMVASAKLRAEVGGGEGDGGGGGRG